LSIVTKSANDAAVVVAEALGGTEENFAFMMTRQARALGMAKTSFYNASGLPDPRQVTTARDMAILGHALIYHYPRYYSVFSHSSFVYDGRVCDNHNHLMKRYEGMDGIKTGYIRASGFNLAASAEREGLRLIGVVFGGRSTLSRDNQMAQLLDKGFAAATSEAQTYRTEGTVEAQGDANDIADTRYIELPSKVAAIFPPEKRAYGSRPDSRRQQSAAQPEQARSPSWGIQVGAYSDADAGRRMLAKMARDMDPLLKRADPVLQQAQASDGSTVYRVRYMGMGYSVARSLCSHIVKQGQGCLVVSPGPAEQS
jgi:D-alanyl-D-alanine carboxypeptidase